MMTLRVLLASGDRSLNNAMEVAVLDQCYGQAAVECNRVARLEELTSQGCGWQPHLIIVAPDDLIAGSAARPQPPAREDVCRAIRRIKNQNSAPILAVNVARGSQVTLLEAGADGAMEFPLNRVQLKSLVRDQLHLTDPVPEPVVPRRSLFDVLLRGWHRLKNA